MSYKEFESKLGNVAVTKHHIERQRDSEEWEKILDDFTEEELVDKASFDKIEEVDWEKGSVYNVLKLKISGKWRRMFFKAEDPTGKCAKLLNYRVNAYKQNH